VEAGGKAWALHVGIKGVAVGPRDTMTFQVGTMPLSFFLNKGEKEGASMTL